MVAVGLICSFLLLVPGICETFGFFTFLLMNLADMQMVNAGRNNFWARKIRFLGIH